MTTIFMWLRALHAETLRLKRTLALRLVFTAPLPVVLLATVVVWEKSAENSAVDLWDTLTKISLGAWSLFMLPLLVTLVTALLNSLDHNDKIWKHLFALPVPRSVIYLTRLLMSHLLVAVSTIMFVAMILVAGWVLMQLRAGLADAGTPPFSLIFKNTKQVWLSAGLIIAIHHWISIRWAAFTVSLGAGIAGTFFALFASGVSAGRYFPWLLPSNVLSPEHATSSLWLGIGGGILAAALGCVTFVRRDVSETETGFSRSSFLLAGGAVLLLFAVVVALQFLPEKKSVPEVVSARIENGLLPEIQPQGEPAGMKLADRMAHYHVPGVSVAVIQGGVIAWAKGYGVRDAGASEPVTSETLFQAASLSKPVTALAALRLAQQGRVSLDAEVNAQLRGWRVPENEFTRTEKVTLRRLLSHSAGLTPHGFPGYAADAPLPTLLQTLNGQSPANNAPVRVAFQPGSQWRYSGGGYLVVQQLLTDVVGQPFPALMQELVFSPLQMSHSTFAQSPAASQAAQTASGHDDKGQAIRGRWSVYPELAAAGLWTTPTDLARLALALRQAFNGESERILSQEMARAMLTRQAGNYGLGVEVIGEAKMLRFSHQGANNGFRCVLVAWPATGQGAVVMVNGERGDQLANEFLRSLAKEYQWPGFTTAGRTLAQIAPAIYRDYVGRYQAGNSIIPISTDNGRLYLQASATESPRMELYPLAETRFFLLENDAEISFVRVAQERVTALQMVRGGVPLTAPRLP